MEQYEEGIKIFLDDVRLPHNCLSYMHRRIGALNPIYADEWIIVRNFDQFKQAVELWKKDITHISFDHDLGYVIEENGKEITFSADEDKEAPTGYDCAVWLKNFYNGEKLPRIFIHSANPVGSERIKNVFVKQDR